jgi:hypothetical protein
MNRMAGIPAHEENRFIMRGPKNNFVPR